MKQVKLFSGSSLDNLEKQINEYISQMHNTANIETNGNVCFEVHDIKFNTHDTFSEAMVVYSHQL